MSTFNITNFLEKAIKFHGDRYDYSNVNYINSLTKVKILCKIHGEFEQTPKIHYKSNCPKCGRDSQINFSKKSKEQFILESKKLYGEKYNYSLVEYINNKTPVEISCGSCGIFKVRPDLHLRGKSCDCFKRKTKSTDKEMFLEEVVKLYGDKYSYKNTEIHNSKGKIKVDCNQHGEFIISVQSHLNGQKCPKCAIENYTAIRAKTTEEFVLEAAKIHGDNCDYTNTIYKTAKDKVTVRCTIHNNFFSILPINHLSGTTCRKCFSEKLSKALKGKEGTCGYTKTRYIKQANGREAYIYLIRCYDSNEEFYKIGRTFLSINNRFTKSNLCYNFEELFFYFGEAGFIYDLEKELHRKYKAYKYKPNNWFPGHTECFSLNLPTKEIINL